jgi:hypothetical protein
MPKHLTVDETAALLRLDQLGVLDLVAAGGLSLEADGVPSAEVEVLLRAWPRR